MHDWMQRIACYCRVSTEDQNLERQLESTNSYAQDHLGAPLGDVEVFRDKSTGTDTSRSGYQEMMDRVDEGEFEAVVVLEISRLARSLQDLDRTVDRVTDADTELHFVRDSLQFTGEDNPMRRLQMQMLGAFAEWEARVKQMNTKEGIAARQNADEDYHHGRAPLGFEKDDGQLIEGENYHTVVGTLDMVQKGDLSKRKAANELGTSRPTITRALDRVELYGL